MKSPLPILALAALGSAQLTPTNLSPNGKKAGLSGYPGIQKTSAFSSLSPYISWYSDYNPDTPTSSHVLGVGMLWGASGSGCPSVEGPRLKAFNTLISGGHVPQIMFGFYEPDCGCDSSSDMSVADAAGDWKKLLAPLRRNGTVLGSPSMCKQKDEDFLTPFRKAVGGGQAAWDVTSIHVNKPDLAGVKADVEYYVAKYGKPVWVSEFACVHDQPTFKPCTDQGEIDGFINDVVGFFQGNASVVAYGPSNGAGLGSTWPLTDKNGALTKTGMTYLNAIKGL